MPTTPKSILALDVGEKRVGVAIASLVARLPHPLSTLERSQVMEELKEIIRSEEVGELVVGLPRGLDGQTTAQTSATEKFVEELRGRFDMPIHFQDEALTSKKAEEELRTRGIDPKPGDLDALAATYILEDFLSGYTISGETEQT